jgi:hypothetical protein
MAIDFKKISNTYYLPEAAGFACCCAGGFRKVPCRLTAFFRIPGGSSMYLQCPRCRSTQIQIRNYGKKAGGAIGTVAGAASGFAAASGGARIGATVGAVAGPIGSVAGGLIGGLLGAVAGGSAGASIGEKLDESVLNNCACEQCGYTFNVRQR